MNDQKCDCETFGRLLGVAFLGLHLPLLTIGLAHFLGGVSETGDLILAALTGTLGAAVITLGMMWRIIGPRVIAQFGQNGYKPGLLSPN
ncbi:hypothetical protein [Paragemmobacter ruber]|uniref:Uncharacterized protein n=1 Tax=Paragemmobacter ruber TaxID=1985673 RepID=A0ABW9YC72_9RHOB|nr:hypothetical protein [Rhodobacter ruber]NBE09560.1 hypothetical protein [Rhodobacter ruber]